MKEHYIYVPALGLKKNDRILSYQTFDNLNLTVVHAKWDDMPKAMYKCIRAEVVHQNGDEEYLFLRAKWPIWVMRKEK